MHKGQQIFETLSKVMSPFVFAQLLEGTGNCGHFAGCVSCIAPVVSQNAQFLEQPRRQVAALSPRKGGVVTLKHPPPPCVMLFPLRTVGFSMYNDHNDDTCMTQDSTRPPVATARPKKLLSWLNEVISTQDFTCANLSVKC